MPRAHRRGFTLLELMVALTLTALAAGIAGTALTAARRTSDVITAHQTQDDLDSRLRALLTDALRHGVSAERVGEPLMQLAPDPYGSVLQVLTRGLVPPFGTGPVWRLTVRSDGARLILDAVPITGDDDARVAPWHSELPGVATFRARVLEPATALDGARWRDDWPLAQARPVAAAFTWERAAGRDGRATAPLVVLMDPLAAGAP